jgi:hypothetical protein
MNQGGPSQVVQIVREPIAAGSEATYEAIEQDTARACAELKCPHPHLALEPVDGAREVWWLNVFSSERERQRVVGEYARNVPLMAVLERNSRRKAEVTGPLIDLRYTFRPELSRGSQLELAGARFVVVTINPDVARSDGAVFEAKDGTRILFRAAGTRQDAERGASRGGARTTVLAIRPSWGMPDKDWLDADPVFWEAHPILRP